MTWYTPSLQYRKHYFIHIEIHIPLHQKIKAADQAATIKNRGLRVSMMHQECKILYIKYKMKLKHLKMHA